MGHKPPHVGEWDSQSSCTERQIESGKLFFSRRQLFKHQQPNLELVISETKWGIFIGSEFQRAKLYLLKSNNTWFWIILPKNPPLQTLLWTLSKKKKVLSSTFSTNEILLPKLVWQTKQRFLKSIGEIKSICFGSFIIIATLCKNVQGLWFIKNKQSLGRRCIWYQNVTIAFHCTKEGSEEDCSFVRSFCLLLTLKSFGYI